LQVCCSDTGYLDYVGLFMRGKRVNLLATPRERREREDILTKLHR